MLPPFWKHRSIGMLVIVLVVMEFFVLFKLLIGKKILALLGDILVFSCFKGLGFLRRDVANQRFH